MNNIDEIWERYKSDGDDSSRNKLFLEYTWIVRFVINKLNVPDNKILDRSDLTNIGMIGLNEAIERFEPERKIKFESYAITRVKGTIQDELRKLDWLSRTARKKAHDISEIKEKYLKESGTAVSDELIIEELGITEDQYKSYLQASEAARSSYSMNESQFIDDDENFDVFDTVSYEDEQDQLESLVQKEKIGFLSGYLKKLPEKKRLVIALYYYEELTFKEIGKLIDVTEGRVSQIHSEVLNELKVRINNYENA